MKGKILYLLAGLVIISGLFFTRTTGLDEESKKLIDEALAYDTEKIFPTFNIDKYPQDVNYGKIEYRYYKGKVTEQRPDYPLALSAAPTEEGPVTKVMPIKDFRNFYDLGDVSRDNLEKAYVSVLIHEAFHCHQIDHGFPYPINEDGKIDTKGEEAENQKTNEAILDKLDDDKIYQSLWLKEMEGLVEYRDNGNSDIYKQAKDEKLSYLKGKLSEDEYEAFSSYIYQMEVIEGTARFVENKVLDSYDIKRNGEFDGAYSPGPSQFYTSGALKAEILEDQGKLGQIKFDMSVSLDELMNI